MPNRVTTYSQAFIGVLGIPIDAKIKVFLKRLEQEGHTEKGISFGIWRSQDKLNSFKNDRRFMSILENEINKWSWRKDDPRWTEYWNKKNEVVRVERLRKEIDCRAKVEKDSDSKGKKPRYKGYIYFIQGQLGGAIKIGYSVNPQRRLKELQTGYPDTLRILVMIPGNEYTEKIFYRQFEGSRLNGEWFRPDDCVMDKINELKRKHNYTSVKEGVVNA